MTAAGKNLSGTTSPPKRGYVMPPHVRAECQRLANAVAQRLLVERTKEKP
jgi:hypothetical protein